MSTDIQSQSNLGFVSLMKAAQSLVAQNNQGSLMSSVGTPLSVLFYSAAITVFYPEVTL